MHLQSGHSTLGAEHIKIGQSQIITSTHPNATVNTIANTTVVTTTNSTQSNQNGQDTCRYLDLIQDTLKEGWSAHGTKEGRLYYCK